MTGTSSALLTDHYELTMVRAAISSGTAFRRSVFELFPRRLPAGRRYGVVGGTGRALDAIERFRFGPEEIDFLLSTDVVDEPTAQWLADFRFSGDIWGYAEGDLYFPGSPLLTVEASFAEAVVLETLLLSVYNYDSAVASAASRMTLMADGRPIIEMGSRRANEMAGVAAARAAYIAGFTATSNLEAGRLYQVPTRGTAAHSFTLLHDSERDAFQAQIASLGEDTTLLVDTYDIETAVRTGVELTGGRLGSVRIDSGDLVVTAKEVRALLDDLGATSTQIMVTSDLDEWQIAALAGAPVDGYGVGTSVVTGSGFPTCSFVYKLVARADSEDPDAPLSPVAKKSVNKSTVGGRKYALRRRDAKGYAEAELVGIGTPPAGDSDDRPLLVELVKNGEVVGRETTAAARERHAAAVQELPRDAYKMSRGDPCIPTYFLDEQGQPTLNPYARRQ